MKIIPELMTECMTIIIQHHVETFSKRLKAEGIEVTEEISNQFFKVNQQKFNKEAADLYQKTYRELQKKVS